YVGARGVKFNSNAKNVNQQVPYIVAVAALPVYYNGLLPVVDFTKQLGINFHGLSSEIYEVPRDQQDAFTFIGIRIPIESAPSRRRRSLTDSDLNLPSQIKGWRFPAIKDLSINSKLLVTDGRYLEIAYAQIRALTAGQKFDLPFHDAPLLSIDN